MDKDRLQQIDSIFEEAISKLKPLIEGLDWRTGTHTDCYVLSAYGDIEQGEHKINKAKELHK